MDDNGLIFFIYIWTTFFKVWFYFYKTNKCKILYFIQFKCNLWSIYCVICVYTASNHSFRISLPVKIDKITVFNVFSFHGGDPTFICSYYKFVFIIPFEETVKGKILTLVCMYLNENTKLVLSYKNFIPFHIMFKTFIYNLRDLINDKTKNCSFGTGFYFIF